MHHRIPGCDGRGRSSRGARACRQLPVSMSTATATGVAHETRLFASCSTSSGHGSSRPGGGVRRLLAGARADRAGLDDAGPSGRDRQCDADRPVDTHDAVCRHPRERRVHQRRWRCELERRERWPAVRARRQAIAPRRPRACGGHAGCVCGDRRRHPLRATGRGAELDGARGHRRIDAGHAAGVRSGVRPAVRGEPGGGRDVHAGRLRRTEHRLAWNGARLDVRGASFRDRGRRRERTRSGVSQRAGESGQPAGERGRLRLRGSDLGLVPGHAGLDKCGPGGDVGPGRHRGAGL